MSCPWHDRGTSELYVYGELDRGERHTFEAHLDVCAVCRAALAELEAIRHALDARGRLETPEGGDWTGFMARLDARIDRESVGRRLRGSAFSVPWRIAATLALVTASVLAGMQWEHRRHAGESEPAVLASGLAAGGLEAVTLDHLDRSRVVVLGLRTRDPRTTRAGDWSQERHLASTLLADTIQYRLAAAEQGLDDLAGVLSDLEVLLLQASLGDEHDPGALPRLQRLIDRRDLLVKIEVVGTLDQTAPVRAVSRVR